MKKINNRSVLIMLLLVIFAASFMFGCGDNKEAEKDQRAQKQEQLKERQKEAREKAAAKKEQAKKKAAEKKAAEKKAAKKSGEKSGKSTGNKSTGKTADNDSSKGNDEGSSGSSAKDKKSGGQSSSKKPAKTNNSSGGNSNSSSSSSAKNSKKTCTIKITCSKLVGNNDLDDAQRARVPKSGVILEKTTVEISNGDSVYDILKKACKKKGIVVAAENTGLGIYVAGIDGFYEKDAGGESGWKYKVNGKYPNDSAGDVKVKNGDVIEWVYVLEA
jgi:hypothetical protein